MLKTRTLMVGTLVLLGAVLLAPRAVAGLSCDTDKGGGCFFGGQLGRTSPDLPGGYSNSTSGGGLFGVRAGCFFALAFGFDLFGSTDLDNTGDSTYQPPGGEGRHAATRSTRAAPSSVSGSAVSADANGLTASVMGILPVHPRVQLFGIAGAMYWRQSVDLRQSGRTREENASGLSPTVSLGAQVLLGDAKKWGLQLNARRVFNLGDEGKTGVEADYDSISVGVTYHLGGVKSPR